jgi:hypothetical protein
MNRSLALHRAKAKQKGDEIVDTVELSLRQITYQREEHGENSWKYKEETMEIEQSVIIIKDLANAGLKFNPTGYGEGA